MAIFLPRRAPVSRGPWDGAPPVNKLEDKGLGHCPLKAMALNSKMTGERRPMAVQLIPKDTAEGATKRTGGLDSATAPQRQAVHEGLQTPGGSTTCLYRYEGPATWLGKVARVTLQSSTSQ